MNILVLHALYILSVHVRTEKLQVHFDYKNHKCKGNLGFYNYFLIW